MNNASSSWGRNPCGVLHGSFLGPLLFNIFIYDLFSIMNNVDFPSYSDDNIRYVIRDGITQAGQ